MNSEMYLVSEQLNELKYLMLIDFSHNFSYHRCVVVPGGTAVVSSPGAAVLTFVATQSKQTSIPSKR